MYNKFSFLNRNVHSFYKNNNLNKDIFGNRRVNFMAGSVGGASQVYTPWGGAVQNTDKLKPEERAAGVTDSLTTTISSVGELQSLTKGNNAYLPPDVYAALARGEEVQVTLTQRPPERVNLLVPIFALGAQMLMSSGSSYNDSLANAIQGVNKSNNGETANTGTGLNAAAAFVGKYGNDYSLNPFGGATHIDIDAQYQILSRKQNDRIEPINYDNIKRTPPKKINMPKINGVPQIPSVTSDSPTPEAIPPIAPSERKPKPTTIGDILDKKDFRLMTTEGYKGKFDINLAAQATGISVEDLQKLITDSNLDTSGTNEKFAISFLNKYGDIVINDGVGSVLVKDEKGKSLENPIGNGNFRGNSAVITDMDSKASYAIFLNKDTGKFDKTGEARAKVATDYINAGFVSGAFDGGVGNFEPSTRHHDNPAAYAKKVADAQAVFNKPEYKGKSVEELLTIAKNDPKKAPEIYSSLFLQAENNTHVENGMYGAGHIGKMQEAMVDRANVFVDGSRAISNIYNQTPLNDEEKKGLGDLVALYNKSNSPAINIDLNNPKLSDQDALKLVEFSEKGLDGIKTQLQAGFKDAHYNLAVLNVQIPNIQKGIEGLKSRIQDNSKPTELPKAVEQYNNISAKYSQIIDAVKNGNDSLPDGTKVSDAIASLKKDIESLGTEGLSNTIAPNIIENLNKKVSELEDFASGKSVNGDKLLTLNKIIAQLDEGKPLSDEQKKFIDDNKDFIASTKSSEPNVPVTAESILSTNDKLKAGGIITGTPESDRTIELSDVSSSLSKIYNGDGGSLITGSKLNPNTNFEEGGTLSDDGKKLMNFLNNNLKDPKTGENYKLTENDMIRMIRQYQENPSSESDDSKLSAEKPEGKVKIDKFKELSSRYEQLKSQPLNQNTQVEIDKLIGEISTFSKDIQETDALLEPEKSALNDSISSLLNKIQPPVGQGLFKEAISLIKTELLQIKEKTSSTALVSQIDSLLSKPDQKDNEGNDVGNDLNDLEKLATMSQTNPNKEFVRDVYSRLNKVRNDLVANKINLNDKVIVGKTEMFVKDYIKSLESDFSSFLKDSKNLSGVSKGDLTSVENLFISVNKVVGSLGEDINSVTTDIMNGIKKADQVIGKSPVDAALLDVKQSKNKDELDQSMARLIDELNKSAQTNRASAVSNFSRADAIINKVRTELGLPAYKQKDTLSYAFEASLSGSKLVFDKSGNAGYEVDSAKLGFAKLLEENLRTAKKQMGIPEPTPVGNPAK
ncbi:MAG: hypothetical protein AABZ74_13890 [Cyanobacteriota bacterium]